MGELEQAKDYHEKAMEIFINILGPNDINVAASYNNLGSVYEALGELEQAKDYHESAMKIWINVLGRNHINLGSTKTWNVERRNVERWNRKHGTPEQKNRNAGTENPERIFISPLVSRFVTYIVLYQVRHL